MTNIYVKRILDNGYLVSPDIMERVNSDNVNFILVKLGELERKPFVVDAKLLDSFLVQTIEVKKEVIEEEKVSKVVLVKPYKDEQRKYSVPDFVSHFKKRYEALRNILMNRQEMKNSVSINRLSGKPRGEKVAIIGLIQNKSETKNGNLMLNIEDITGIVKVLINKDKKELIELAKSCLLDECVGITGSYGENIIFVDNILLPDVPIINETKKCPDEVYAVFISDIHFGIKNFLHKEFENFMLWMTGEYGNEKQRDIASKVRYLFLTGDLVEGVGIYPNQDKDLEIDDIYIQYESFAKELRRIPSYVKLIMCGGNHDAVRMSEPQPALDIKYTKALYELPNAVMVSNPATVNIHAVNGFSGLNVLMYHGFSFPFIAEAVEEIRVAGGQGRSDLIMKYLLQRRHVCPEHGMNLYVPDPKIDPLVIETIPDVFVTGHIHRISVSSYRGVTLINSSCWDSMTEDQEKRGLIPDPAKAVVLNLKTREASIIDFKDGE